MAKLTALFLLTTVLGTAYADDTAAMLQSQVKAHDNLARCSHLAEAIKKQAAKKVDCAGGLQGNGEPYCKINSVQHCPGGDNDKGGWVACAGSECCINPCPGVAPYGNSKNFPCPSAPPGFSGCENNTKIVDCLDPCAPTIQPTTEPTTAPPSPTPPTPTEAPSAGWVCTEEDLKNPPMLKGAQDMACETGALCYGEKLSTCTTDATCYATKTLDTCNHAHCCAGRFISVCTNGSRCYAKKIGVCEEGAQCKEEPSWNV